MTAARRGLRVGTRGSALALEQTRRVVDALARLDPGRNLQTVVVSTVGDRDKRTPLAVIGGQGVFAKEIQAALLAGDIDLAVHSAKDLPSEEVDGLELGAFLDREDPRDVLIAPGGRTLAELPAGARVGTSSQRRRAALRRVRPDLQAVELRGNVDTRLRKVREGEVDAAIIAAAGVLRMGLHDQITEFLPLDAFVPSPGQGVLAVECRAADDEVRALLAAISDPGAARTVGVERAFLRGVGGGCRAPIGAHASLVDGTVTLRVMLGSEDLSRVRVETITAPVDDAAGVAEVLAVRMRAELDGLDASPRPLAGKRVLVTRAAEQAGALSALLREQGAEPVELPVIAVVPPADTSALDAALGQDTVALDGVRIAAIGAATAARLAEHGLRAAFVPERFVAEEVLAGLLARGMTGARVLLPRAEQARDVLPEGLRAAGATVDVIPVYRIVLPDPPPAALARVAAGEFDVVTLTSSSTARNLVALLGGRVDLLNRALIACIGPITAETAREMGLRVDVVAEDYSMPGLVAALCRAVATGRS